MSDFADKSMYNDVPPKQERQPGIRFAVSLTAEQVVALVVAVGFVLVLYYTGPIDFECTTASTVCIR